MGGNCACRSVRPRCFTCFPPGNPPTYGEYYHAYKEWWDVSSKDVKAYGAECAIPSDSATPEGGRKNDEDKLRYDLIPPGALAELARVYTIGAKKYADNNWRGGFKWGRIFAALMRHAWDWWRGERDDPRDGQHHLASVAWGAFTLMEFEKEKIGEDDRWKYS